MKKKPFKIIRIIWIILAIILLVLIWGNNNSELQPIIGNLVKIYVFGSVVLTLASIIYIMTSKRK